MTLSKEAKEFAKLCFKNGKAAIIRPFFDQKYINANNEKFTEDILNELISKGCAKITYRDKKQVNIMGIEGFDMTN
jgi:hypothetical protein